MVRFSSNSDSGESNNSTASVKPVVVTSYIRGIESGSQRHSGCKAFDFVSNTIQQAERRTVEPKGPYFRRYCIIAYNKKCQITTKILHTLISRYASN